jgi:hypothetical protein
MTQAAAKLPRLLFEQPDIHDRGTRDVELFSRFGVLVVVERQLGAPLHQPAERARWIRPPRAFEVIADLIRGDTEHSTVQIRHPVIALKRTDAAADEPVSAVCPAQREGTTPAFAVAVGNAAAIEAHRNVPTSAAAVFAGITQKTVEVQRPVVAAPV